MSMLSRLDHWLGTTLFHPPIIAVCHLTRQSQNVLNRTLWFFAACHATYYADGESWGMMIFLWIWVAFSFLDAAIHPDRPARSLAFVRALFWFLFVSGVIRNAMNGEITEGTVRHLIILFAEYAATIKTLPPRRKREHQTVGKAERI